MQTIFELKTEIPFDLNIFENMRETAVKLLTAAEHGQYTEAIVLFSGTGNQYSAIIKNALSKEKTDETSWLEKLKAANDTEIHYVLCMWQVDNCIDIPSFAFRELLCSLNPKNSESLVFVMTAKGVAAIKVCATMR